ncbi:uncharacterized protein LOC127010827 [Drosophila biarmipes]|uniref:uncharacterized protein LOC127010827 n=1 Tax=Drosophila biarmipes TaxID=125945 RepID=UPI0021CCB520|nr:uncharacterized protein LOC127010827 [Drosophila biarmipes]
MDARCSANTFRSNSTAVAGRLPILAQSSAAHRATNGTTNSCRATTPWQTKPDYRLVDRLWDWDRDRDRAMAMTATMMVLSAWKTIGTFNEAPYDFLKSIQEDN